MHSSATAQLSVSTSPRDAHCGSAMPALSIQWHRMETESWEVALSRWRQKRCREAARRATTAVAAATTQWGVSSSEVFVDRFFAWLFLWFQLSFEPQILVVVDGLHELWILTNVVKVIIKNCVVVVWLHRSSKTLEMTFQVFNSLVGFSK